jgi:hypothetical protein
MLQCCCSPQPASENVPRGTKSLQTRSPRTRQEVCHCRRSKKRDSLKLTDRFGNVYENKGPLWKNRGRSRNLHENTGTYTPKAGMLLKRKIVSRWQGGWLRHCSLRGATWKGPVAARSRNASAAEFLPGQSPPLHQHDDQAPCPKPRDYIRPHFLFPRHWAKICSGG